MPGRIAELDISEAGSMHRGRETGLMGDWPAVVVQPVKGAFFGTSDAVSVYRVLSDGHVRSFSVTWNC
jgi:hypothetical protein